MLLKNAVEWLISPLGKLLGAAAVVATIVLSFAYQQQAVGTRKATARQEKSNADASRKAAAAARKSVDPAAGGLLNPYYRQD